MNKKVLNKSIAVLLIAFLMFTMTMLTNSVNAASAPAKVTGTKVEIRTNAGVKVPYLSWNKVAGAAKYEIYTGTGSPWSKIATVEHNYFAGGEDDLLINGEYSYWVRAIDSNGNDGEFSNPFDYFKKPSKPTNLKVTKSGDTVKFTWGKVNGAKKYYIYKYTRKLGTNEITQSEVTTVISNSYTSNLSYYGLLNSNEVYAVVAETEYPTTSVWGDELVKSDRSNYATYRSNVPTPTGVKASIQNGKVTLSWNPVTGADGYKVYNGSKLVRMTNSNSCTITDLSSSQLSTFKVYAYANDDFNKTKFVSKYASISAFPNTVSSVKVALNAKTDVKVTWKTKGNVTGYKVYRSTSKTTGYKMVRKVTSKTTGSYVDKKLESGKTYYYKVIPYITVNGKEYNGGNSNIANIKTFSDSKVTGLTVNSEAGTPYAYLKWKKSSNNIDGYFIYRATSSNGKYTKVKNITSVGTTSFKDQNLTKGQTYYYKVVGYKNINGKAIYTKYSDIKNTRVAYMKRDTKIPHNGYTSYGDRFTIKTFSMQYKGNVDNRARYQVKMKIEIESTATNDVYYTLDFYDKNNNYIGYYILTFGRRVGNYTKTVTWNGVDIPKNAASFTIE